MRDMGVSYDPRIPFDASRKVRKSALGPVFVPVSLCPLAPGGGMLGLLSGAVCFCVRARLLRPQEE